MQRDLYSRQDETRTADGGSHRHFPGFEACYKFDDPNRPKKVTIFEHGAGISTTWITAAVGDAVPVELVR